MQVKNIVYWITTVLVCFLMAFSGYNDLIKNPEFVASMKHLGYPEYIMAFLGVAKFAAVIVLLIPFKSRLKDWAYAGVAIDLAGAAFSHYSVGDSVLLPLLALVVTLTSYYFYCNKK